MDLFMITSKDLVDLCDRGLHVYIHVEYSVCACVCVGQNTRD